jgi:hypothetical protein
MANRAGAAHAAANNAICDLKGGKGLLDGSCTARPFA